MLAHAHRIAIALTIHTQSKVQIWYGMVVSLIFLVVHLRLDPFRDRLCNAVQLATHVQCASETPTPRGTSRPPSWLTLAWLPTAR